jgi:hypothetical protein
VKRESGSRGALIARNVGTLVVWSLPVVLPIVVGAISLIQAVPESSDSDEISWAFIAIPAVALLGAFARVVQSVSHEEKTSTAWLGALVGAAIGAVIGYGLWWEAVVQTCHGRYECPF